MTDQQPQAGPKPTPLSQLPQTDVQALLLMVQLLLDEKREAAEEKAKIRAIREKRDSSDRQLSAYNEKEERNKQRLCTHLKNLPSRHHFTPRALKDDYAVSYHVYPDGVAKIRCLICGAVWHKGDTAEKWTKNNVVVKNWTKLGWIEAMKMVSNSTNTPTKSELNVGGAVLGPNVAVEAEELE